ncbi:MAG: disulfide bond formation protein B [Alphaproteobacteria bacterium]|nr:disulfide bond formation protein B [Alphaproteobacteria bacterium]
MSSTSNARTYVEDRALGRTAPLLLVAASAAILAAAYGFEYVGGLAPCELCLYQRIPYAAVIGLGLVAAFLWRRPEVQAVVLALCAVAFAANAALGGYHVGIEQGWLEGPTGCSGGAAAATSTLDELKAWIMNAPVVRCDEVAWSLFGISLSGYNAIASVLLTGASVWFVRGVLRG